MGASTAVKTRQETFRRWRRLGLHETWLRKTWYKLKGRGREAGSAGKEGERKANRREGAGKAQNKRERKGTRNAGN